MSDPSGEFSGRRILVTGATGTIGRATAQILADAGAHVVLNGRDQTKLENVAATLPPKSSTVAPFDLMDGDGIPPWLLSLAGSHGPFAGVAHVAGVQDTRPLRIMTVEFINMILQANVTSSIMLGRAFRHKACHAEGGSLVLVASTAAFIGGAGNVAYGASKGAVIAAAKGMAHELLRDKIRVNCVVPGLIDSDMSARARDTMPPESWQTLLSGYPMGIGTPPDIAHAIVYLLSARSRWTTGAALQIDGGLSVV